MKKWIFFTIKLITWPQYGECPTHRKETAYEIRAGDQTVQIMQEFHALSVHIPTLTQKDVSWMLSNYKSMKLSFKGSHFNESLFCTFLVVLKESSCGTY